MGGYRTAPVDFTPDAPPVPLIMMIITGTGHVQEDASETGVSQVCLHNGPIGWNWRLLAIILFTISKRFSRAILRGFFSNLVPKNKTAAPR